VVPLAAMENAESIWASVVVPAMKATQVPEMPAQGPVVVPASMPFPPPSEVVVLPLQAASERAAAKTARWLWRMKGPLGLIQVKIEAVA
jgi:hypothetical protein